MIILITGRSGSGKTTVVNSLISILDKSSVSYLHQDSYYQDQSQVPLEKRNFINFDHPDIIDIELFTKHLSDLSNGITIEKPIYNYKTHTRETKTETIHSKEIILADGLYAFYTEKLRDLADIKVFVDVPNDICFIRRLLRDTQERERSVESVINQYIETVRPMQEKYVLPLLKHADFIIKDGGHNIQDIEKLVRLVNENIKD